MLLKRTRMVYWKKWAAKHELEALKEGVWMEPQRAMLRRKTNTQAPTRDEEIGREGEWVQKRLYNVGWSDEKKCRGCNKEEGTEKHRLYHGPCWKEVRNQIPEDWGEMGAKAKTSKKDWKWQRGITAHPLGRRSLEEKPLDSTTMGLRKAQKLGHFSRWFLEPCHRRWSSVGSVRQVGRVRLVGGAARSRRRDGVDGRDVRNA